MSDPATFTLRQSAEADDDIFGNLARVAADYDVETALTYVDKLEAHITQLSTFPHRGTVLLDGLLQVRSMPSQDPRYLIIFTIDEVEQVVTIHYVSGG